MKNVLNLIEYCNHNGFIYDPKDSIQPLWAISRMLNKAEKVEVAWTSPFAAADIYADQTLFDNAPVAFAITNQRIICTDSEKKITIPLADFNGVFVSESHDSYGADVVLATKNRLLVFGWHDAFLKRLVRAIETAQANLLRETINQYEKIYGEDS